MPITLLDGILLVIMLLSAVLAMIRGFVREVLSIASWVAAAVAAYLLYGSVLPFVKQYVAQEYVALGVAVAGVFLVTLIVVSYITMRISDFVLDSRIGALDRTLGFVFGALRGLLLVVVAMLFFNWFVPEEQQPQWIVSAKSKGIIDTIGNRLVAALPEDPEKTILESIKNRARKPSGDTTQAPAEEPDYSASERQGLDQLTNSGGSN
ncbi:CvpA family protein [Stappia sp. F7233]|uniref:CvpA family protein n=1 Tax=Stappia albiluteola TaxID=2758565 RepID=A0A839ADB2_9HYPH|nr:CvpA family protein [Stappia albiluteola]MBA5776827.1 CvpA family protein [Stappia albiluteola]